MIGWGDAGNRLNMDNTADAMGWDGAQRENSEETQSDYRLLYFLE